MLTPNKYFSYHFGNFPAGCQYCVRGEKLVLFSTGLCPRKCYFCPVSDQKFGQDGSYANERKIENDGDLLLEAELMQARGAGITGGDPLMKMGKTVSYIQKLKEKYGKGFHVHLYTSLNLVTENNLRQLHDAGLDEIRFHLDLESKRFWPRLELARKFSWKVGVEIPSLPHKEAEMREVINFIKDKVDFLNLNELEIADNKMSKLAELGFQTKDSLSYAVEGSLQAGLHLMEYAQNQELPLPIHLCTAKLKDAVQLANRLKRESANMRRPFDLVSKEGLLTRGALYLPELAPGFSYRKKLETCNREELLRRLQPLADLLKTKLKLNAEEYALDHSKPRILLAARTVKANKKLFRKLGLLPAVVKEYPTADQLEIEVEMV